MWSTYGNRTMAATTLTESGTYNFKLNPSGTTTGSIVLQVWTAT